VFLSCECCVLSGRGLCGKMITRPEEFYRLWCIVLCDLLNLMNEEAIDLLSIISGNIRLCRVAERQDRSNNVHSEANFPTKTV